MSFYQLKNASGYYSAVFDGHGGWQVADLCSKKLHIYIDEELAKQPKNEEGVRTAISIGFDKMEEEWVDFARTSFNLGYPKAAYVGACALVSVVIDNKLYVASSGDCKAVMISELDGKLVQKHISKTFSANKKYEQERLRADFPERHPDEIVMCKRGDNKACYVMGCLMPSRSFGDLRLKHNEFN